MEALFTALTRAVEGTPLIALGAAGVWGVLSIVLSPCHLASLPLIIGFVDEQGGGSTRRAFWLSILFASGVLVTIAAIGVITAALGKMMGQVGAWGNYLVAAVFLAVGLHLLGVIPLPLVGGRTPNWQRKGLLAALLLGLIFGIALGPCTFAYMAPMLMATFRVAATNLIYGVVLLLAYGIGHCAVIVFAGTFTGWVQGYLNWTETSRAAVLLRQICGALVILGGLYLVYIA